MGRSGNRCGSTISVLLICLGLSISSSTGADKNAREAVEALEAYAVYKMALYEDAFSRFMALAQKGNHQGMLNIAGMLSAGQGSPQDLGAAFKWYQRAANDGSPIGMFYVAEAYQHGHGVQQDHTAAQRWYLQASETGSEDAQIAYARLLLDTGDSQQAIEWLTRWADTNRNAAELLNSITGSHNSGSTITALDRVTITNAWKSIDRSARAGNAHGMVYYLDHRATVRVRLPGLPTWAELTKEDLRGLWQRNFDLSGQYRFARDKLQIERISETVKRYKVESEIDEVLSWGMFHSHTTDTQQNAGFALTIAETAIITLVEGKLLIEEITLDIFAAN